MSVIVNVLYPKTETSTFDLDYYMKTHMPLAQEKWTPYGLTNWTVAKLHESGPYSYQAILFFESEEAWVKAQKAPETPIVMGDVPNFSSEAPILLFGNEVEKVL